MKTHVRWMIRVDMPAVLQIERASFEYPWREGDFIHCLRQRNCIGMSALRDDVLVGYMIYELHRERLQLLSLAVLPDARRHGVGTIMIDKLKGKMSSQRRTRITTEVREGNCAGHLFLKSNGFMATDVVRDFYDDSPEDAYVFQYEHSEEEWQKARERLNKSDQPVL